MGANRVLRWDKPVAGKPIAASWIAGHHAGSSVAAPCGAKYLWRIVGGAYDCVAVGDVENSMIHVWDKDGLWAGRLLDHPDLQAAPAAAYELCGENFGGSLSTNPKTGNVLFFGGGTNNTPVYRIRGWDEFQRQSGKFSLSAAQVAQLKAHITEEAAREDIAHVKPPVGEHLVDGDLKEWANVKPLLIKDGDAVRAKVYLAWHSGGLLVAFDVNTSPPWKNSSTEQLAFQGSASVDVRFGPWEPERKSAGVDDICVVAAPVGGKTQLVIYASSIKPGVHPAPATFETGNGKVTFPRVATESWAAAQMKPDGTGYFVEMHLPNWWTQQNFFARQRLRFDAGIGLSNPEGTKTISRFNWHSRDANDMATDDVFTEATLRPQNWGEARME